MSMSCEKECLHAGLDPKKVERIAKRLDRIMADANNLGISLFCGGFSPSLRFNDRDPSRKLLVVGYCDFQNSDGGDGGCSEDGSGLLRGE